MISTDHVAAGRRGGRFDFGLDRAIGQARRVARQHPFLIAAAVLVVGGAGAATAAVTLKSSNPVPAIASDCGRSVSGSGFRVFSCMSGGASAGHPHPKELLVIRSDGSSVAYPVYRTGWLAHGDGEVIASYNLNLVRVTTNRLVPLLTGGKLARALHVRFLWNVFPTKVGADGDIYFTASALNHSGCENPLLELTTGGRVHQIGASRDRVCH